MERNMSDPGFDDSELPENRTELLVTAVTDLD
jgi:hypothetical protein